MLWYGLLGALLIGLSHVARGLLRFHWGILSEANDGVNLWRERLADDMTPLEIFAKWRLFRRSNIKYTSLYVFQPIMIKILGAVTDLLLLFGVAIWILLLVTWLQGGTWGFYIGGVYLALGVFIAVCRFALGEIGAIGMTGSFTLAIALWPVALFAHLPDLFSKERAGSQPAPRNADKRPPD